MSDVVSPCAQGEDFAFLAHCVAAGDFSLIIDGYIHPHYLSEAGQVVAEWLLYRSSEGRESWPPSYDVIREQWPDIEWPEIDYDVAGLDPSFSAGDVWYSYKNYLTTLIMGTSAQLAQSDFTHENYASRCAQLRDWSVELAMLKDPRPRLVRVGADPEEMFNLIIGETGDEQILDFMCDMEELHHLFAPYTSGLYMFFGRPKHTKSWRVERNAWYHGIVRGKPCVLVDPENATEVLYRRIACFQSGLDYGDIKELVKRYTTPDGESLTKAEHRMLEVLYETCCEIQEMSQLVIIGKDQINKDTHRIEIEYIFAQAEEIGARVLFCEQIHKYGTPGLSKHATETTRINRSSQVLADSKYLVMGTTQEKRTEKPKAYRMPHPHEDWVFGGDGVAQNCSALVHVHRFEMQSGEIIIMLTPLLGRDGEPGTVRDSLFVKARFGHTYEVLSYEEGRAMAEAVLLMHQQREEAAAERAKTIAGAAPNVAKQKKAENRPPRPGATRAVSALLGKNR